MPAMPEAIRRGKKNYFRETSEGVQPCEKLDFELVALRTLRKYMSVSGFLIQGVL